MLKQISYGLSLLSILAVVQTAPASLDIDGTPWHLEFDGTGNPAAQGWTTYNFTSSTYAQNTKYLTNPPYSQTGVDWLSTVGNAGGLIGSESVSNGLTKAGGWTVEWRMLSIAGTQVRNNVIYVDDDTSSGARIDFGNNSVTLRDGWTGTSQTVALTLTNSTEHTYRLVRQPNSNTVELYIDNNFGAAAASITLFGPTNDNNNRVLWGDSVYEGSYDFFRFHSGATTGIPEPTSLALLALGSLSLMRWRNCSRDV